MTNGYAHPAKNCLGRKAKACASKHRCWDQCSRVKTGVQIEWLSAMFSFMGGLYGRDLDLRRRGIEVSFFHNEALEPRRAKLAFGMQYEILLGVLCNSNANTATAATFFLELLQVDFDPACRYLEGFVFVLNQQCDLSSCELEVRREYKHTPMDFPRPSPARLLVWDFAARLAGNSFLYSRLRSIEGAEWFFHTVRDRSQRSERDTTTEAKTG
jgi:hypothetical protein